MKKFYSENFNTENFNTEYFIHMITLIRNSKHNVFNENTGK